MNKNTSLLLVALLFALALSVAALPASAKAQVVYSTKPFLGNWAGTDTSDGSSLKLTIRAERKSTTVKFSDSASALCGGLSASGMGVGVAVGTTLHTQINIYCKGSSTPIRTNYNLLLTLTSKTSLRDVNGNAYVLRGGCTSQ